MNKYLTGLTGLLLITVALAGCHEPAEDPAMDNGLTEDPLQVTVTILDPPTNVTAGVPFDVTVQVESDRDLESDHAGAHYGNTSSEDADPTEYTMILSEVSPHHFEGVEVPGEYTIEGWTIDEALAGETIYYRGHIILEGNDYWSDEHSFTVEAA